MVVHLRNEITHRFPTLQAIDSKCLCQDPLWTITNLGNGHLIESSVSGASAGLDSFTSIPDKLIASDGKTRFVEMASYTLNVPVEL